MREDITKAFPHAVVAEKSTLSTMLQNGAPFVERAIEAGITPEHYYDPGRSILFEFICERIEAGASIDLETIFQALIDIGKLDRIGGQSAFTDIYTYSPSPGHFDFQIKALKDKWAMRQLLNFCSETETAVWDSPAEVDEVLDAAEKAVMAIREGRESLKVESIKEAVSAVCDDFRDRVMGKEEVPGLATGFRELDAMTGGLKPGNMFVIAARPSMGKTSFMMNIVEHACVHGELPTLVFSCEMTQRELVQRLMFSMAKFDSTVLSYGEKPTKGDLIRIQREALRVASAKLEIDDTPGITISQMRAKARRIQREKKIGLIAIDYLQLMRSFTKQAIGSREREISEISAGVKGLAKELGIPVIILAQLNRGPEARGGKKVGKPRMSDLRDSGSIEQDADIVGLLYRDAYYAEDEESKAATAGRADLDLAKNRNGPTGNVPLTFINKLSRFESGHPASVAGEPESKEWNR